MRSKIIDKKILTIALIISMILSHLPSSLLMVNATSNNTSDTDEYVLESDELLFEDGEPSVIYNFHSNTNHFSADLLVEDLSDEDFWNLYLETDEQVLSEATLDDNFEDNAVVIVLNRVVSRGNRTFTTMDFGDIGVVYVEDLNRLSDQENEYAQALWTAERNMILAEERLSTFSTESNQALVEAYQVYSDIREEAEENTLLNFDEYRQIMLIRLDQNSKENVLNVIQQLQKRDYIYWAGPNYIEEYLSIVEYPLMIPNDPYLHLQWAVNRLSLPQAWNITTGSRNVRVGILGSRIDANHRELQGRVRADLGGIFYSDAGNSSPYTWGTQQAGIIGAMGNNGFGIAGIAWNTEFVPLRAVNAAGSMPNSAAISAINHARQKDIPIISRSFGITTSDMGFFNAVRSYTGLFVNAAGNSGQNTDANPLLPSLPNVLIVGASDMNDGRSVWSSSQSSNFGRTSVHLFAPGGGLINGVLRDIWTTAPNNSFGNYSGTSAAAPHVAGVAALVLSVNPELSPQQARDILTNSVDQVPAFANISISGGRLNAYRAVRYALATLNACTVVAEGRLANQPGANGMRGAPWVLCDDGTLEIGEGFINSVGGVSPWNAHRAQITRINITGSLTAGSSLRSFFDGLNQVTEIEGLDRIDTSGVTNMVAMFQSTHGLTGLDVSNWDTSNVTDMAWMFNGAISLTELDLSGWNTSRVTDMGVMFQSTHSLARLDISTWDTRNVTSMGFMFTNARELASLDVSNWDVRNVRNMNSMFAGLSSLRSLDLSNWDTRNVTSMNSMFAAVSSLRSLTLGRNFRFIGTPSLPTVRSTNEFTGMWQNVGNGTIERPTGSHVFTSAQLIAQFNGATMADTWVWQPR